MEEVDKCDYTPLPEPVPITEQQWPEGTLPLVHIRTMTYMHENFIRDCIEGILMQKTTFPVQVLIHDDASTDKTSEIVREYELKYPQLVKAYYQKENTYSKRDNNEKRALREIFNSWRIGKFEALCEGDDYWIDPLKLQRQVEILENNPGYGAVAENAKIIFDDGSSLLFGKKESRVLIEQEMLRHRQFATASILYRNCLSFPDYFSNFFIGDTPLMLLIQQTSPIYYNNIVSSVYRRGQHGITAVLKNPEYKDRLTQYNVLLDRLTGYRYPKIIGWRLAHENLCHPQYNSWIVNKIRRSLIFVDKVIYFAFLFVARPKQKHFMDIMHLPFYLKIWHLIRS